MSTITKEFTKEQLQQIEAAAKEVMWPVVWSEKKAREHFSEKITPKVVLELARIALVSLEAEAAYFINRVKHRDAYGDDIELRTYCYELDALKSKDDFGGEIVPVYTAPPAPVSVPDLTALDKLAGEMLTHAMNCERRVAVAYTHCAHRLAEEVRDLSAAMLHGADGNSPVIPDGCCIMPKKLTAENGGKGALSGEFHVTNRIVCQSCAGEGCEDCNDEGGWDAEIPVSWDTIKRIHEAAVEACSLPAAPQREVRCG